MQQREVWENWHKRRETWVTWAGPGHGSGSWRALLVTGRTRQQLMYAGHRKAELGRCHSLWDLCSVDMMLSCPLHYCLHTSTDPGLYGRTRCLLQETWLQSMRVDMLLVLEHRRSCKYLWAYIWFRSCFCFLWSCCCRHMAQTSVGLTYPPPFSNHFIHLLREESHFQLEAFRKPVPSKCRFCESACSGCAYPWLCVYMRGFGAAGLWHPHPAVWTQRHLSPSLAQLEASTHHLLEQMFSASPDRSASHTHPHITYVVSKTWSFQRSQGHRGGRFHCYQALPVIPLYNMPDSPKKQEHMED